MEVFSNERIRSYRLFYIDNAIMPIIRIMVYFLEGKQMNRYDKITFYACVFFLLLLGFAGGLLTALGVVFMIWRWIV